MSRHDWSGKVIHWELCKKFKFDQTDKWYIHNPISVLEKKKITSKIVDLTVPADHRVKFKEREKKDKYLDLAMELKKTEEH